MAYRTGSRECLRSRPEIAEPDRDGGALRYRGVDVEELVGALPFEGVWGLLVDGRPDRPLQPAGPHPLSLRTGDTRVDVQSAIAALAPRVGLRAARRRQPRGRSRPARAGRLGHALVRRPVGPRRRRGPGAAVADRRGPHAGRALPAALARRGRPRRGRRDRRLLDHRRRARDERLDVHRARGGLDRRRRGRRAQRRGRRAVGPAARRRAGARAEDADAVGAQRRRRSLRARSCSPAASGSWASGTASTAPRTRAPGRCAGSPSGSGRRAWRSRASSSGPRWRRWREHKPDRVLATNVEFWSAVVLDHARVPQALFTPLFVCARTAGLVGPHPRAADHRPADPPGFAVRGPGSDGR